MKMNKIYYFIATLTLVSTAVYAQGPEGPKSPSGKQRERIEAMKIGFLSDRLQLTPDEAKVFWPVYDQYQNELEKLRKDRKENLLNGKENMDEMSDAEIEKTVDNEIAFRQAELDIVKKYHPQFKKVLPVRKVGRLYRAEEEFKRELLRQLQERKDGQRPGPRPGPRPGR
ncbi:MAG: hypothetical protein RL021_1021 [Bacteroidota bacterium]|jgi:hypothetical protein